MLFGPMIAHYLSPTYVYVYIHCCCFNAQDLVDSSHLLTQQCKFRLSLAVQS